MTAPRPTPTPVAHPRLSHNIMSTPNWSLPKLLAGCAEAGVTSVGLWREPVAALGMTSTLRALRETGLAVSSLCRAGFFPVASAAEVAARADDNCRAVEEAAALGTDVLVILAGGLPTSSRDLAAARAQVEEGLAALVPVAADHGVRLAIEPLHPALCGDRSVVVTLEQALDLALRFPPEWVGVMVDTFHLWWDPHVWTQLDRAAGRILGFQVSDCPRQLDDPLHGRQLPGHGVIALAAFRAKLDELGYRGPIEVELFNRDLWAAPGPEVLRDVISTFDAVLAPNQEVT